METIRPYNEQTLLDQIAEGDETAFRKLVNQYSDLLSSHIYRLIHSREQTEEIVQDVFLKIWMTREALAKVRNFKTYLYVVSRNQALNAIRSIIRERTRHQLWEKTISPNPVIADPNLKEQQLSLIDKAIEHLPPQQKKAWILSRMQGLKYRDIALEMNLSQETVKKYIQYANLSISHYVQAHLGLMLFGILL